MINYTSSKKETYLRYSGVTTFPDQHPRQHGTGLVLYLAIVIVGCDDDHRADYFALAIKFRKEKSLKLRIM